jgi:hypothetical protein
VGLVGWVISGSRRQKIQPLVGVLAKDLSGAKRFCEVSYSGSSLLICWAVWHWLNPGVVHLYGHPLLRFRVKRGDPMGWVISGCWAEKVWGCTASRAVSRKVDVIAAS